jgi:hypothetical protein
MNNWPLQSEATNFYGDPRGCNGKASLLWKAKNLTHIPPPFAMYFAGTPVSGIAIHNKCADSLARVLCEIWIASGKSQKKIDGWGASEFGGSFNFRLMRGSENLSMHAYGCAIDLSPTRFPMGRSAPTFCAEVLKAFADEGWVNLPRDRMHFQAARL